MSGSKDPRVDRALTVIAAFFFALCAWTFQGLASDVRELGAEVKAQRNDVAVITTRVALVEAKLSRIP